MKMTYTSTDKIAANMDTIVRLMELIHAELLRRRDEKIKKKLRKKGKK